MAKIKYTYLFKQVNRIMSTLLGVKGANIAYISNNGLPAPPGFTITTKTFNVYY